MDDRKAVDDWRVLREESYKIMSELQDRLESEDPPDLRGKASPEAQAVLRNMGRRIYEDVELPFLESNTVQLIDEQCARFGMTRSQFISFAAETLSELKTREIPSIRATVGKFAADECNND